MISASVVDPVSDKPEARLANRRYPLGDEIDPVDVGHINDNFRPVVDYPNLSRYLPDLHQAPSIAQIVNSDHFNRRCYVTRADINPSGIVASAHHDTSHHACARNRGLKLLESVSEYLSSMPTHARPTAGSKLVLSTCLIALALFPSHRLAAQEEPWFDRALVGIETGPPVHSLAAISPILITWNGSTGANA